MNEAKLKACPFCNSDLVQLSPPVNDADPDDMVLCGWQVVCRSCGTVGGSLPTETEAGNHWNTRAGDRAPEANPNDGNIAGSVSATGSASGVNSQDLELLKDASNAIDALLTFGHQHTEKLLLKEIAVLERIRRRLKTPNVRMSDGGRET